MVASLGMTLGRRPTIATGFWPNRWARRRRRAEPAARVQLVDEGLPIAYEVLDRGVPVYSSDGERVGTVDHVVAAPAQDIFHGLVLRVAGRRCFVAADDVGALHEHGVDLR